MINAFSVAYFCDILKAYHNWEIDSMTESTKKPVVSEADKIAREREINAHPGFFLRASVWILSRFPLTKNRYQNWTSGRRILVGWLLWLVCLPIIPAVAIAIWYFNDPEGFKQSPWAKGLIALFFVWLAGFGFLATEKPQLDQNGKYSPVQTQPDGEKGVVNKDQAAVASKESKEKVAKQATSKSTGGRVFNNCTEAFNAGVFDIKRSDPSYQSKLDRDNDGIACER